MCKLCTFKNDDEFNYIILDNTEVTLYDDNVLETSHIFGEEACYTSINYCPLCGKKLED